MGRRSAAVSQDTEGLSHSGGRGRNCKDSDSWGRGVLLKSPGLGLSLRAETQRGNQQREHCRGEEGLWSQEKCPACLLLLLSEAVVSLNSPSLPPLPLPLPGRLPPSLPPLSPRSLFPATTRGRRGAMVALGLSAQDGLWAPGWGGRGGPAATGSSEELGCFYSVWSLGQVWAAPSGRGSHQDLSRATSRGGDFGGESVPLGPGRKKPGFPSPPPYFLLHGVTLGESHHVSKLQFRFFSFL